MGDLDGDEMDAYLEWFEQHILSDEKVPSRAFDLSLLPHTLLVSL